VTEGTGDINLGVVVTDLQKKQGWVVDGAVRRWKMGVPGWRVRVGEQNEDAARIEQNRESEKKEEKVPGGRQKGQAEF